MSHLIEDAAVARRRAEALRGEYLRLLSSGASDEKLAAVAERLHAAAVAWAAAQERAGLITEVWVVAGERLVRDRAGHTHHIGAVGTEPLLGDRSEGCVLVLPESLGGVA